MGDDFEDLDAFDDEDLDEEEDLDPEDEKEDEDKEDEEEKEEDEEEEVFVEKDKYASHYTIKIISRDKRRTSNRMSLFEFVSTVGTRAQMIENGDEIYTSIEDKESSMEIAEAELREGRCPLMIERKISTMGNIIYVEIWKISEMIVPNY